MFGLTEGKNIVFFAAAYNGETQMMIAEAGICECCGEIGYNDAEPTATMGDAVVIPCEIRELVDGVCPLCAASEMVAA